MEAPDENALLALFAAGFGENVENLLSPEQIRVLPNKIARAAAHYGYQLSRFADVTEYPKLEAWINKLIELKEMSHLNQIMKRSLIMPQFLKGATTPFLWNVLRYLSEIKSSNRGLENNLFGIYLMLGDERWTSLLKEPNPTILASLFQKDFLPLLPYHIPLVIESLEQHALSDPTLLTSLIHSCNAYESRYMYTETIAPFKAKCEARLQELQTN